MCAILIGFKAHPLHKMEPLPDSAPVAKNLRLNSLVPTGKPDTIVPLKEHSIKVTLNNVPYTHDSASLSHHQ